MEIKINTRVALESNRDEYKLGVVAKIKDHLALVEFDNHPNRWCRIDNLLEIVEQC